MSRSLKNCGESHIAQTRAYANVVAVLVGSAASCAVVGIMLCTSTQFMINDGSSFIFFSEAIFLLRGQQV